MTGSISVSESCSRVIKYSVKLVVAVAFAASALLVSPAFAAEPGVTVSGMAPWLAEIAERSLSAVMKNIPEGQSPASVRRVVAAVSEKIFTGYKITTVSFSGDRLAVAFEPENAPPEWETEMLAPALRKPADGWFASDIAKVGGAINELVRGLPIEALSWCDEGLRDAVAETINPVFPGWRVSLAVQSDEKKAMLKVSFTPEQPMILAVTPSFSSASLPMLIYEDLKNDLLEQVSVFIGLPTEWAALHSAEMNSWIEAFLADKNIVSSTKSKAAVKMTPAPVSRANINLESSRYTIWGWSAVYAGTKDRSAEVGLHLGRKAQLFPHQDMELYGEAVMELRDWSLEGRFGVRFMPWGDVWVGGEYSTADEKWWARFSIDPRVRKPYAWLRVREDGEINTALGWKATEFISFEIHYDSRDGDSWSLKILGNL